MPSATGVEAPFVNIAAYKFVSLDRLEERQKAWRPLCEELGIKGTILLSPEGINLFVAASRQSIDSFLNHLRADVPFADLEVKESPSDHLPHRRMLIKIKKEIIAFGVDGISPQDYTSPRVSAHELKAMYDRGETFHLLDVRNTFEFELGTFAGALGLQLEDFRKFPEAIAQLPEDTQERLREAPLVTFCTGGIRCEKAAPYLEKAGFRNVLQLDGGILKYFEECGDSHYDGECFVFDQRVALDANLQETDTTCCYACQSTLTRADRSSEQFVEGESCPHCWTSPEEERAQCVSARNEALASVSDPLPGSVPYENLRPLRVPGRWDGLTVIEFLEALRTIHSREDWMREIRSGAVRREVGGREVAGGATDVLRADDVVRSGNILVHAVPGTVEPDVNGRIEILYEDESLVVVNKPAPLPVHPSGRFHRNTATYILDQVYAPGRVRPAHRLDADTSGLLVFSRTRAIARRLQPQFERGEVEKTYLAKVEGIPTDREWTIDARISSSSLAKGARRVDPDGQEASTHCRLLETWSDGAASQSLLEVRPVTGRTNQIRLHLEHVGLPIVGDPLYSGTSGCGDESDSVAGSKASKQAASLHPDDPPMCLHAWKLTFLHPTRGERIDFEAQEPRWAER